MKAIYSSAANRDVKQALDYYERTAGAKIADDFLDRLERKVETITQHPESFRVVARNLRGVDLDRFPYQVVYRIVDKLIVRIVSVRHHKRHPNFGLNR